MATTLIASGTATAAIGIEASTATLTPAAICQIIVDCSAMALGDVLEVRVYTPIAPGFAEKQLAMYVIADIPTSLFRATLPQAMPVTARFGLLQAAGTQRSFPYAVWAW